VYVCWYTKLSSGNPMTWHLAIAFLWSAVMGCYSGPIIMLIGVLLF